MRAFPIGSRFRGNGDATRIGLGTGRRCAASVVLGRRMDSCVGGNDCMGGGLALAREGLQVYATVSSLTLAQAIRRRRGVYAPRYEASERHYKGPR